MLIKRLLLFTLLLCASLSSQEEDEGPLEPSTPTLINLEGEPSSLVAGCVNVITGDFIEGEVDAVLGFCDPVIIQRVNEPCHIGKYQLGRAWSFNHFSKVAFNRYLDHDKGNHFYSKSILEDTGSSIILESTESTKKHHQKDPTRRPFFRN